MNKMNNMVRDYIWLGLFIIALMFGITQKAKEIYMDKDKTALSNFVIR